MTHAVNLFQSQSQQMINARDLYLFLESRQKFADWIGKRLKRCGFAEGEGFFINLGKTSEVGGRPTKEYTLTPECAIVIASNENTNKGREFVKFFMQKQKEREGQLSDKIVQLQNSNNHITGLLIQTNKDFYSLKEKTIILEASTTSAKWQYNLEEAAGEIGVCEKKFCQRLRDLGYLEYRLEYGKSVNVPTYKGEKFIRKEKKNINGFDRTQSYITKEGIKYFKSRITEYFADILKEEVKRLAQPTLTNLRIKYEEKQQLLINI